MQPKNLNYLFFSVILLLLGASFVRAQNVNTGTVVGPVNDRSGAVIPGATVELRDTATSAVRASTSNASGRFNFVAVPPATYKLAAGAAGFENTATEVHVEVGKSYTFNLTLQVGTTKQTVEVTASAAAAELQTMDSTVGETIGGDTLHILPMPQRNVSSLLLLQPASMQQQQPGQNSTLGGQVAGTQSDQGTIMLDGGNVTNGVSGNSD